MKEFIFSKFADLQSLIDYRPRVFYMYFSRTLTAEEAQLVVETRLRGCFRYKKKHKTKTSNNTQLT